jgi:stearoyl-CoA desaturase (delta-9 desaturase)
MFSWVEILACVVLGHLLGCIGQLVALHRYFSHRSFEVNKFWKIVLTLSATLSISGPIVAWANTHRNHHTHSDTSSDPHSPKHRGVVNVFFANWWYYRHQPANTISDYNNDPLLKFTFDYYYVINVAFILMLCFINPYLLFPLYFYPGIIGPLLSSIINAYLHRSGAAQDSKLLAWVIFGDGYHKFHHDNPGDAMLPAPDVCGIMINLIRKRK